MKHVILVIDDNINDINGLRSILEPEGFSVKGFQDPYEGIASVRQNKGVYSLAIVDYTMPEMNGPDVTKKLKEIDSSLQIATYSGENRPDVYETLAAGSEYFIQKSLEPAKILAVVKMFCARFEQRHRVVHEEPVSEKDFSLLKDLGMVGRSNHLIEVARLVHTYAPLDETILITGENGTGKERIARSLHKLSGQRGEFVPVNCGAISNDLLESELFGHLRGSFSGAVKDKVGLIQYANNGTIFLDEFGDLPLHMQVKLLRFLQEGEVRPVGSNQVLKVNTRVIVATNVDLENAVNSGKFREDLYYRVKGFTIHLKPLRERIEDLGSLVAHFAQKKSQDMGRKIEFLEDTVRYLKRHQWRGNIRELEAEVHRAMVMARGPKVEIEDINIAIRERINSADRADEAIDSLDYEAMRERQKRRAEAEERQFILESSRTAGSIRELAERLGLSNSTLQGRLKALNIVFKTKNEVPKKGGTYEKAN